MRETEPLHIFLLGPPDIQWEGKPYKFSRRVQRALLFYLAVEGIVSRGAIQELFWPYDIYRDRSNANFRVNLARLRKDLPLYEILQTNKDTIWLNKNLVSIDAVDFLDKVDQPLRFASQFPSSVLLPDPMVSHLRQAAELWRSPRFLHGFSISENNPYLEQWLEKAAWSFNDTHMRVLNSLAGHFAAAGDLDAAIQWADAALDIDPWAEKIHIQKINWLLSLNRTSTVLNTIQTIRDQYSSENEELPDELAALFHTIRREVISHEQYSASEDWPGRLLVQVPLIGRRTELLALQTAFRRGGTAVVWGETGSGKTRLAYELHRSLQPRPRLLVMNAIQGENRLPYQPWINALRRGISQKEWQNLAPRWLQQVAHLLPELEVSMGSTSSPIEPSDILRPGLLYDALHQILLMVSRAQRVLIVLDSAQWCDSDTLAALAYLVERRFFVDHGMLMITARRGWDGSPLETFLVQQSRSVYFMQMDLSPFNLAETEELALQVLDEHPEPGLLKRLVADTGGIPLFLLEALYDLLEYAPSIGHSLKISKLPVGGSIHNFLRERIEKLSLSARQVAEAAGLFEPEFDLPLLAVVSQLEQNRIVQGLDELHQAGLIQQVPDTLKPTYKFVYGQMREVIRWGLGPAHLRLLHLRAARAIEEQPDQTVKSTEMLAHHYEAAGEILTAIRHWVTAGMQARAHFSIEDALNAFRSAERLALRDPYNVPEDLLNSLYTLRGEIASDQTDYVEMEQIYSRMVDLGEQKHSALLLGNGLGGLASMYALRKDLTHSMEIFQRAVYHLQQLDDPAVLAGLYGRQGWNLVGYMRYDEAITLLENALQLIAENDDPQVIEQGTVFGYRLGMVYSLTGWPLKAQETVLLSLKNDQTPTQVSGHLVMAGAKYYLGEFGTCIEHTRLGIRLARSMHAMNVTGYMMTYQLRAEVRLGQIDTAWSYTQTVSEFALKYHLHDILTYVQVSKGDICRLLGDLTGALGFYRAGMEDSVGKWDSLDCQLQLGSLLVDTGQVEEGLHLVDETLQQAGRFNLGIIYLAGMCTRAVLLTKVGRLDEAIALLDEYQQLYSERRMGSFDYTDKLVRGQVFLRRGDLDEARRQAGLAVQTARRIGNPFQELEAFRLLKISGAMDAAATDRVKELLVLIDHSVRHPDLRPLAEKFLQSERTAQSA